MNNIKFDLDDILISPSIISNIDSRSKINPYYKNNKLPLFTAPMFDVVDENNIDIFNDNGIHPILPRTKIKVIDNLDFFEYARKNFVAVSLDEFDYIFNTYIPQTNEPPIKILIDIANGHMRRLYDISKAAKEKFTNHIILMIGNIANPYTFKKYCEINVDYVRVGIGSGSACLTTQQTAIGYPMGSLIYECKGIKSQYHSTCITKIVADGGMRTYSDIIKSLALGADYVMLGGILNKCLESSAETKIYSDVIVDQYDHESYELFKTGIEFTKVFRGMSTKEIQREIKPNDYIKTSEGIIRTIDVEYTVGGWTENFTDYLKSAMSYCDCEDLNSFIGQRNNIIHISRNSFDRFNK